ncbi:hypothetical protein KFK09_009333 [Dendrobium nobile]|uniref:Uncharacterized protein n=1 Tax=Dendrobium nobile TaxID=94219 RepID=A0A8T3BS32_DENNO|nr:hypothetical protein KFK09_009333 [Dendrobium nobile]
MLVVATLLAGWKVKFLSFVGRIQYLKFTIANSIAYWIRGAIIPKAGCKLLDRMCAMFLYHGAISDKKLHLISWKNTTLPYCYGGLDIPDIKSMYFGFACSFLWRFFSVDSLLNSWYRSKFVSPFKPPSYSASPFWKHICSTASAIKSSLKLNVTSFNCSLSLYWDPWVKGNSLADLNMQAIPNSLDVNNWICNGSWDLSIVPSHLHRVVLSIPIHDDGLAISWTGKEPC